MPLFETREWSPTQDVYKALAEEFGEDNDADAIDAFTEVLVKRELRVSLTRPLLAKCLTYLRIWAQDEEKSTTAAIDAGVYPAGFIPSVRRAIIELKRIDREEW